MTALRLAPLQVEPPVVGADHEVGGDGSAVRACLQVGDVALDPGQRPRLAYSCRLTRWVSQRAV